MFTGLIEEIGKVRAVSSLGAGRVITVSAKTVMSDLKVDDSISLNGVCQTVVRLDESSFTVEAVGETLLKTSLANIRQGIQINLERAARLGDRLGGHLVQGHVDCTGRILSIDRHTDGRYIWIGYPPEFDRYLVQAGSICIDGVSLTTARVSPGKFMVSIIPHTLEVTIMKDYRPGDEVNLEFDIIGKYIEKLMMKPGGSKSTEDFWEDLAKSF